MIKARGRDGDGNPAVIIGITDENWKRLRTGGDEGIGQPIMFDLRQLGLPPMKIVILGGKTEEGLEGLVVEFFMEIIQGSPIQRGE